MEKQNTPKYNTKYVNNFVNFNADAEKEELGKLRRDFKKNPDQDQTLPVLKTMKFNKVTKTMQTLSKDEVIDKEHEAEEIKEHVIRFSNFKTSV